MYYISLINDGTVRASRRQFSNERPITARRQLVAWRRSREDQPRASLTFRVPCGRSSSRGSHRLQRAHITQLPTITTAALDSECSRLVQRLRRRRDHYRRTVRRLHRTHNACASDVRKDSVRDWNTVHQQVLVCSGELDRVSPAQKDCHVVHPLGREDIEARRPVSKQVHQLVERSATLSDREGC